MKLVELTRLGTKMKIITKLVSAGVVMFMLLWDLIFGGLNFVVTPIRKVLNYFNFWDGPYAFFLRTEQLNKYTGHK